MTREEFMRDARETAKKILAGKENGIMNLVQYAWAEGKRNAEVETITEIMKQAYDQVKQKGAVDVKAPDEEFKSAYEKGFNDAMLGKQELMYEGMDGKWHMKDW